MLTNQDGTPDDPHEGDSLPTLPLDAALLRAESGGGEGRARARAESITYRRHTHLFTKEEKEHMKNFESLDFRLMDNILYRNFQSKQEEKNFTSKILGKWVIAFLIGIIVGLIVYFIKKSVDKIQETKFHAVKPFLEHGHPLSHFFAFLIYYSINLGLGLLSTVVVIIAGPVTSSSGIPEVKGYLNGIRIKKAFNIKTLLGKVVSLVLSFSSGLVLGPEGPMFHIGSTLGAALSQFKSKTFGIYSNTLWKYQNDLDKRDFISCGAAAGIAAAFGAPIGGVLFCMEEGSSFWSQSLTWRTFFACLIATFTANLFLQDFALFVHDYGVLQFGLAGDTLYSYPELIPFCIIGVLGGLIGALFVHLNVRINKLRKIYLGTKPVRRLIESAVLITITTAIGFGVPFLFPCRPESDIGEPTKVDQNSQPDIVQFTCPDHYFNDFASLFYTPSESALKLLFTRYTGIFNAVSLPVFGVITFILATITSGVYMASGFFIPMMAIGASLGRFAGWLVVMIMPNHLTIDSSTYAVVGAAALMAGSLRLTISLVVILVELTEGTQYLLPIILVVMIGKWVGDYFNESVYEHLIELKHIPYLPRRPAHHTEKLLLKDVMTRNVSTLPPLVSVRDLLKLLRSTRHNGFPVVMDSSLIEHYDNDEEDFNPRASRLSLKLSNDPEAKKYVGLILRNQLIILLQRRIFGPLDSFAPIGMHPAELTHETTHISHKEFSIALSRTLPDINTLPLVEEDYDNYVDLRPYLNLSSLTVSKYFSFTEAYNMFRAEGLRHLVVVDEKNCVVGMLTRKDFL